MTTKKINKAFEEMSDDELSDAKRILDKEIGKLREQRRKAGNDRKRLELESSISAMRASKLDIQKVQDGRLKPLDASAPTIGVVGIEPKSEMGKIGGR